MIISIRIVGRDKVEAEWGNGNDGLREIIMKLEIREREWMIGTKDADASGELWFVVIWINN